MQALRAPTAKGGRWCSRMGRSSGFPECAAATRQPTGPAGRFCDTAVNATMSDPRLAGRSLRRVAFDEAQIAARVRELGEEITRAYPSGDLLVLGLLKGS